MIINLIQQHADQITRIALHFLWQGTAIAVLAALVGRFLLNSPRHRSALYLASLAALALCVPVTMTLLSEPAAIAQNIPVTTPAPEINSPQPALSAGASSTALPAETKIPLTVWFVGLYFLGLALMMTRVIRGFLWSNRTRRRGTIVNQAEWITALNESFKRIKLRRMPTMFWSENVSTPIVTGILRPMIVLPVSLMTGLPREQAIAVLSHELAHLRRHDHIIVVFQRLLEALFFFHPAVWVLSRCLDQEREKACDDLVLNTGNNRADYAEALVALASDQRPSLTLAAAGNEQLIERVMRILNHHQPTTVRVNRGGWLAIAATITTLGFLSLSSARSQEKEKEKENAPVEKIPESAIMKKLRINLPEMTLNNATLIETVEFLRLRSIELDPEPDSKKKGLNFVVRRPKVADKIEDKIIDDLVLRNVTFQEALSAVCRKTGTQYKVDEFAITILPKERNADDMLPVVQRRWTVPPNFLQLIAPENPDPARAGIVTLLKENGIAFPSGSSAAYLAASNTLIVRNTPNNLDLIDQLVKSIIETEKAKNGQPGGKRDPKEDLADLQKIVIPEASFKNTTLQEAVEFIRIRALELDPAKKGVNINIFGDKELPDARIRELKLRNVPLPVMLSFVCDATKSRFTVEGRTISILPGKK